MIGFIAYIPYAAVGYCVAALATDVWPTLRSGVSSSAYLSSRHGMDGSGLVSPRACDPSSVSRNLPRVPDYCFNTATGQIEGVGILAGTSPMAGEISVFTDEDGRETARFVTGANGHMDMAVCHRPPGSYDSTPFDPGGRDYCGPRRQPVRGMPVLPRGCMPPYAASECGPGSLFRNNDPNRLRRKRMRWG
jgi:hypothetical protein